MQFFNEISHFLVDALYPSHILLSGESVIFRKSKKSSFISPKEKIYLHDRGCEKNSFVFFLCFRLILITELGN